MRTQNIFNPKLPRKKGYLVSIDGESRQTYETEEYTIIGRDSQSQISLDSEYVSTRHSRIEKREDGFYIKDLRSRNGTFVNGCRVVEAKLQDNDRIQIGVHCFVFRNVDQNGESTNLLTSLNSEWDKHLKRLPQMATSQYPILLYGPSGTGKEVLANCIHKLSQRSHNSYLSVNCSALAENLAESELFGHRKGSFTGAEQDRKGAFEAARGGTLFLDEIGDMPMNLQPKFLRALENNEIKPVGSDSVQKVDVRIIAATNKSLSDLVVRGLFREDLYFRLHILQIKLPALKDRMEDFDSILSQLSQHQHVHFALGAIEKLRKYSWPGNIRELKNVISRGAALFGSKLITDKDLVDIMDEPNLSVAKPSMLPSALLTKNALQNYEVKAITERLSYFNGNQRKTALDLGIAKSTLNDKIRKYAINVKQFKKSEEQMNE